MKKFLQVAMIFLAVAFLHAREDPSNTGQQDVGPRVVAIPAYKMTLAVYELENGKRINQRDYSLIVQADGGMGNKIKVGTRVPISTNKDASQFTYTDVGFELDCSLQETSNGKLSTRIDLNVSSFAVPEQNANPGSAGTQPLFRNLSQHLRAVLAPGKPLVVASTDDVNSNKRIQVEVTATKLD
jgi:hypothetical protein